MDRKERARKAFQKQYADAAAKARGSCQPGAAGSAEWLKYSVADLAGVPAGAVKMGMGCGNPVALAELKEGQVVLDLGAGGGLDAFLAARKVAPTGKVIGVDMTEAAVQKARRFAREGGFDNVEFRVGLLEKLPVEDESIDVVISNCVMNHAADKTAAFQEALRVLKGGGRMCVSDLVLKGKLPAADTPGLEVWSGWLEVACGKHDYLKAILDAGFKRVMVVAEALYTGAAMTAALAGKIVSLHVQAKR